MKKYLLLGLFAMAAMGCDDAATTVERYVQFNDQTTQWRAIEVGAESVSWVYSERCERKPSEPKKEALSNFYLDSVEGVAVYSHPSIGEFVYVTGFDNASMNAAMALGNKRKFWTVNTKSKIPTC